VHLCVCVCVGGGCILVCVHVGWCLHACVMVERTSVRERTDVHVVRHSNVWFLNIEKVQYHCYECIVIQISLPHRPL